MRNARFIRGAYRLSKFREWGASLLEAIGAIAVGATIMVGVANQTNIYLDNAKDTYAAEHAKYYAQAARGYVKANQPSLLSTLALFSAKSATASDLRPYLPSGFNGPATNPFGQSPSLFVRKKSDDSLEGVLVYSGGGDIPSGRRQFVAGLVGVGGGYVDDQNDLQGRGWAITASSYTQMFPATDFPAADPGKVVVALSFFNPADLLDNRYLCRGLGNTAPTDCNKMLTDITFDTGLPRGIIDAAYLSSTSLKISATSNLSINSPSVTVEGPASFSTNVSIGGGLVAETLRARGSQVVDTVCDASEVGTIVRRKRDSDDTVGGGSLLTCKKSKSDLYKWRPLLFAEEEKSVVIGCEGINDYCRLTPEQYCQRWRNRWNKDYCNVDVTKVKALSQVDGVNIRKDTLGFETYYWEAEIGKRLMCALGMTNQGAPSGYVDVDSSGNPLIPLSYYNKKSDSTSAVHISTLIHGSHVSGNYDDHTGYLNDANERTFCRVTQNASGTWVLRAGSAHKSRVSCHAVCLKDDEE